MNKQPREFVFERDTGIVFEHAQPSDQPLKPKKTQFTNIPRLESVNAEEYNQQFEEMRKAMPKNLAYSGKFGTADLPPSAPPKPAVPTPAAPPKPAPLPHADPPKPAPVPPQKSKPVEDNEPIQYYTGYEPEKDPFSDDSDQGKEILIKNHQAKKSGTFSERFKKTFKKLFANTAEDEYEDV